MQSICVCNDLSSVPLRGETVEKTRQGLGGAISGGFFYKLTDSPMKMGLAADIGYKTAGYLEGEKLGRGVIFSCGSVFSSD